MILEKLREIMGQLEGLLTDAVTKVSPWLCPIPTAYLVARATIEHMEWPIGVGIVAALIIEFLGLATAQLALQLRAYNAGKRKTDPAAPFWLSAILVAIYLITALGLTVMLDIVPSLAVYSAGVFPLLSLCGMIALALRSDHGRRLNVIEGVKQERKAKRQASVMQPSANALRTGKTDANMDVLRVGRQAKKDVRLADLLKFYAANPDAGPTEAGRAIGVQRQTIYTYIDELEGSGKLKKADGKGIIVLPPQST